MQYIQLQSQDPNTLPLPIDGFNIFVDQTDNYLKIKDSTGDVYGGGTTEITYSGLVDTIITSGLSAGSFYKITDFRTCYDQPDFNLFGNSITTGNYKQAALEPIVVFATSVSTISIDAYQPTYPNDKIQYDWTYSGTETTNGVAYGRITERIDEFSNRTDYDHRTILFKRYRLFTHRQDQPLNGTIELFNDGSVIGTGTSFDLLNVGDVIYVPSISPSFYEITGITDNTSMAVSGDTLGVDGGNLGFYLGVEETNDSEGYFSYKRTNVKTNDFKEYTTFGDVILQNNHVRNNYVGNFSNSYITLEFPFLLANNVFLEGQYESNKIGNYSYNNTFGTDNQNNIWGDWCYQNVSTNDIDNTVIGNYFNNNLINVNLQNNHIGDNFRNNRLLAENNQSFEDNIIGNNFEDNTIYSWFYKNKILNNFNNNTIGDFGNLTNFKFYRNVIGSDVNTNTIKQDFYDNQIGNLFYSNILNGDFYKNVIGNDFNNNGNIGYRFYSNHIGNGFNGNELIGDYFKDNQIGNYFESNGISYFFNDNKIQNNFANNTLGNADYFNWNNTSIENLTGRTYNTFYQSLYGYGGEALGNIILGKELIMRDTVNNEYHKVKFTQWTQNNNGGGFSYERTKVYPTVEPTVYFTKPNYGNEVDVIVEGSLEIRRDNNGAIYNQADELDWSANESPIGTEWNSIYTQPESSNGSYFENNNIGNEFKGNFIFSYFSVNNINPYVGGNEFSGSVYNNQIGSYTFDNQFLGEVNNNTWNDNFYQNTIGNNFNRNILGGSFYDNTIGYGFQTNQIGNYFNNNTIGNDFGYSYAIPQGNKIGNNFYNNNVGEYFYNNTISDNFTDNIISNYFRWNVVNTNIDTTDFTVNLGNITGFTYNSVGTSATDGIYTGLFGVTNGIGVDSTFDVEVSGGTVIGVSGNTEGKLYVTSNTITILGTQIGGYSTAIESISSDGIGKTGSDGIYNGLSVTGGTGSNATFDVTVISGLVDSVIINNRGNGYEVGDELTLIGSLFGGTDGVDDITITVTVLFNDDILITVSGVTNPSVYEPYTCQLFERQGGTKRLSFYDENDALTITNINE